MLSKIAGTDIRLVVMAYIVIPPGVAIQFYLLAAAAVAFWYWPPAALWIGRMPFVHRLIFVAMLGGMIYGNFALDGRRYFPFVTWDIFGFLREEDPITCREFWAVTASGKGVRLIVEQLFPSIVQCNLPTSNDAIEMTHLVEALADRYNRLHEDDPVRQVDLVSIAVRLHPATPAGPPQCDILRHYEISSGHSL
jgi:hypothetical protein